MNIIAKNETTLILEDDGKHYALETRTGKIREIKLDSYLKFCPYTREYKGTEEEQKYAQEQFNKR